MRTKRTNNAKRKTNTKRTVTAKKTRSSSKKSTSSKLTKALFGTIKKNRKQIARTAAAYAMKKWLK